MRKSSLKLLALLGIMTLSSLCCVNIKAQVTVGSDIQPAKAALLELKSEEQALGTTEGVTHAKNITSKRGGLGLPRVRLVDKTTLEPFITTTSTDWTNAASNKIKEKHAGLMVYNIHVTPTDPSASGYPTDKNKRFKQGVYVWDGAKWTLVGEGAGEKYFYIPSFNIQLTAGATGATEDLYAQYVKQFTNNTTDSGRSDYNPTFVTNPNSTVKTHLSTVPSPELGTLYKKTELDYVITYYDKAVIGNLSVDNDGVLTYDVLSTDTSPNSFMNVVFVIKE